MSARGVEEAPPPWVPANASGQADFITLFEPDFAELDDTEEVVDVCGVDVHFCGGFLGDDPARHLSRDVLNLALEAAYASLVRVMADELEQTFVGEGEVLFRQARSFPRALYQETLGALELFLFRVTGEPQNLHAILQRLRDSVQDVGGTDEHNFRQIVLDIEVM